MLIPELKIPNVADTAVDYFEELILSGVLTPGLVLPSERKLAETLNISRTSLRTAYNKLEAKGLIERRGCGAQVIGVFDALISQPLNSLFYIDKEELFELWKILFRASIATACARRTKHDVSQLKEFCDLLNDKPGRLHERDVTNILSDYFTVISGTTYNFLLHQVLNIVNQTMEGAFREMAREVIHNADKSRQLKNHLSELTHALARSDADQAFENITAFCEWLGQCSLRQPPVAVNSTPNPEISAPPPSNHAMAKVSKLLTSGAFKIGDLMPSAEELSQTLNSTPASIRDALAQLETFGVVDIGKRDQAVVCSLTIQDLKEPLLDVLVSNQRYLEAVIEFRIILEEQTAYMAAERCTPEFLPKLSRRLDLLEEKFNLQNQEDYAHLDIDFHKAIASLSGNGGLRIITSAMVNFFETATARWFLLYNDIMGNFNLIHEQHIAIYRAIEARKPEQAMRAMNEHLSYVIEMTRLFDDKERREDIALLRKSLRRSGGDAVLKSA